MPSITAFLCLCILAGVCFGFQQVPVGAVPQYPDKPNTQQNDKDRKPQGGAESTAGTSVDANTYKVGPADVLKVSVWREEQFSLQQIVVQQNGKFTMPLVGDIQAGGCTPKEIEASVEKALAQYVKNPLVTVTVTDVGSKKYYIDGLANHPGEYQLSVPTTVFEAISKNGGLQDFANQKKIYVLRGDKRIPFNFKEVLRGKNMDQNIHLEPGDHVVVP